MKKKLLFVFPSMYIGGAERSLLSLLEAIDPEKYDVDLFLFRHSGELFSQIPHSVTILPEVKQYRALIGPLIDALKSCCFSIALGRLFAKFKSNRYLRKNQLTQPGAIRADYCHKQCKKFLPKINPDVIYDLAVSFIAPHYSTIDKVCAKKKVAWIHTDYSTVDVDEASQLKMWEKFDNIIAVSDDCAQAFCSRFPHLKHMVSIIENILSPKFIIESATCMFPKDMQNDGCFSLLSVGRFCFAKNFENIPYICKLLLQKGLDIKWYIIGFGETESLIRQRIKELQLSDRVIILGKKTNPYPYISACNIYVQPSRFEGKAVTVREAQILNKPVVITSFPTSNSQIVNGFDGIIVPMDNKGCADGIYELIHDPNLLAKLNKNIRNTDYSNIQEVQKFYDLID